MNDMALLDTLQARIQGCLYGQALGDAMGMPAELWTKFQVVNDVGWIDRFLPEPPGNSAASTFRVLAHSLMILRSA